MKLEEWVQMIAIPDLVNGLFELFGGAMVLLHCLQAYKDKEIKGVNVWATVFFSAWGYWNLYYYPHLNQWLSFTGGIVIVIANTIWTGQMIYYLNLHNKLLDLIRLEIKFE